MDEIARRLTRVEEQLDSLAISVAKLNGEQGAILLLLKYVITPLIVILGGLVGIKILQP